ncbi:glycosyltransferase family 39 protein [Frigoriglobus tundricola]|uniref:Glycosyltransferase RgtA/B/C/D-like domain-containing protein n=1 Tax=Frigoriglobus tundricola TaxID=2774151 RepID=A0A6M5Z3L6_9BACT|nr:glycosyltransferase family 39 protein [Frigoriglobus tundricola]QJW99802.1 hypothetical protein FTUN_7425 [Frigoriglobus tundricola]
MTGTRDARAPAGAISLGIELTLLVALAAAVRLVGVGESLWLDELFTSWVVLGPDGTLSERAALGNAAAPFYWLVKGSVAIFGASEWAIRLPSVAFGAAVPVVVYVLTRTLSGSNWAARIAAVLVALDGFCCAYAAEARPYSVLQFFGALQLLAFWKLLNGGSVRWRVGFVACTIAMGFLQFVGLAVVAGEIVYYALLRLRGERSAFTPTRFLVDLGLAGVALLPLVPLVLAILGRKANFDISAKPVGLEDLVILHRQPAYLILPFVAAAFVQFARRAESDAPRGWVVPLAFCLIVFYATVGPIWVAHRIGGPTLFRLRYTMVLYLLPLMCAGMASVAWPARGARVAFALAALVFGQLVESPARRIASGGSPRLSHDDWRGAVRVVNERAAPAAPVFVRAGWIETDGYLQADGPLIGPYLTLPVRTLYKLDGSERPVRSLTYAGDFATDADTELIGRAGEAWVLVQGDPATIDKVVDRVVARLTKNGLSVTVADRTAKRNVTAFRVVVTRGRPA